LSQPQQESLQHILKIDQRHEKNVKVAAEFFIKRFDFGIQYPGKANDLIRDEVVIRLDITAVPE